jgi:L,D-transpeptidase catalytic domain
VRFRVVLVTVAVVAAGFGVLALAARHFWPSPSLASSSSALARLDLAGYAGTATVRVSTPAGSALPSRLKDSLVWPRRVVPAGERLTVTVTVRRPGWAGWLVGHTQTKRLVVETPVAKLRGRWLQITPGQPVRIAFDRPVHVLRVGKNTPLKRLAYAKTIVPVGVTVSGRHRFGSVTVAAAARSWEELSPPTRVTWFPATRDPQLLVSPRPGVSLGPGQRLKLTFSKTVAAVLGNDMPTVTPATAGRWTLVDAHTISFRPGGLGFPLGSKPSVSLPRAVHVVGAVGSSLTRTLAWEVPLGSTLRLQQLLAQLGYLPVDWQSTGDAPAPTQREQLAAAVAPPPGRFTWRYPNTPTELVEQWQAGEWNSITRGAVMMFQDEHNLAVDAIPGPIFWRHLLADAIAGTKRNDGYSYVYVHRSVPQSLNLWHDGVVVLSSPGNTGVPAAPTQLGTFQVFEHVPVGTMAGTNPDGSHYNDPGIKWISYFHHGEAIHAFNRASFGTPQSLGCVELPLAAAAQVWPYTPIGTLVTIEN